MERTTDIGHGIRVVRDGDNARIINKTGFNIWDGKWGELVRVVALMDAQPELRDLAIHKGEKNSHGWVHYRFGEECFLAHHVESSGVHVYSGNWFVESGHWGGLEALAEAVRTCALAHSRIPREHLRRGILQIKRDYIDNARTEV